MDTRFLKFFNLTEEEAIALLQTPLDQLKDETDRYIAASHLVNFPSQRSINALMEAIQDSDTQLYNRIAKRKALESLGRLKASIALPVISTCLNDDDCYIVENAVWAIGEIGTEDEAILKDIAALLDKPSQSYRVIIHTLGKLDYQPALGKIRAFISSDDEPIASAAITTVARFTNNYHDLNKVVEFLTHPSVNARRACIQDLMDVQYYDSIPDIGKCAVSVVFRLRALRLLAETGIASGKINFTQIEPYLDQVIWDHPDTLNLVHEYDQQPNLEFVIGELYHTDFGRCYLASKTLLETYPQEAGEALMTTFKQEAHNDYGAHYHVIKLFGWLKYEPAYDLLIEALQNKAPQFQKSRAAAACALGNLGDKRVIELLKEGLETKIFSLKYACLMALNQLGDVTGKEIAANDSDGLICAKATS